MNKVTKRKVLARFTSSVADLPWLYKQARFYYRQNVHQKHRDHSDEIEWNLKWGLTPDTHFGWMSYDLPEGEDVPVEEREEGVNGHTFKISDYTDSHSQGAFFGQLKAALRRHIGPVGFEAHDGSATY